MWRQIAPDQPPFFVGWDGGGRGGGEDKDVSFGSGFTDIKLLLTTSSAHLIWRAILRNNPRNRQPPSWEIAMPRATNSIAPKPPSFNIAPHGNAISGLLSGAFMTVQLHLAYSASFIGAIFG